MCAANINVELKKETVFMVFKMSLQEVAKAVNGELLGDDALAHGVSTDTRTLMRNDIFIALRGDNFDGHDFIGAASSRGAVGYIVDHVIPGVEPLILVKDTKIALGDLARAWRQQFSIPVVAVTGSNGKTTVKEMIAAIFKQRGEVLYTQGNFNNDIGLPLTLLSINSHHDFAVIEMGANHMGEIEYLTRITQPDIALITNAGPAHLEGFGGIDNVAKGKGELFAGVNTESVSIINNDDKYAPLWHELTRSERVVTFGSNTSADVYYSNLRINATSQFNIHFPDSETVSAEISLLGEHNVKNAVAASAVAFAYGMSPVEIKAGLASMQPVAGRLTRIDGINNSVIIDDTYNANPASVKAALNVLKHCEGKKIFVLGDLGELGEDSIRLHEEVAIAANESNVDMLFTLGELSKHTAKLFAGVSKTFMSHDELISDLVSYIDDKTFVLVKGSRYMRMERIVKAVIGENGR